MVDLERPGIGGNEVNAWRTIFVANELAELQCEQRIVVPETTLIWFIFFWVGLGWQHYCGADPEATAEAADMVKQNILLKFCLVAALFYGIGVSQYILRFVYGQFSGTNLITQLVDLATLANVSLIVMDEPAHGYYLHGQAPWGKADIPLDVMHQQLQEEADHGTYGTKSRGLKNNNLGTADARIQTFEIYLPKKLRETLAKARVHALNDAQLELSAAKGKGKRVDEWDNDKDDNNDRDRDGDDNAAGEAAPLAPKGKQKAHSWSRKEKAIRQEEYRKNRINEILRPKIGDQLQSGQIKGGTRWMRYA